MVLVLHLRMVVWPRKFWPHLSEKYDGSVNPAEFLQIYCTSILAAGGDEVIMANYFPVALTSMAQSWLMNLPEGSLISWGELCRQFIANFESDYARPGNEVDLHTMQQRPWESLRSFIHQFSQDQNTMPSILNDSVVVTFRQGVKDKKMLEKLATHEVKDVSELFNLVDKCARAAEGCAWHSQPAPVVGTAGKPEADVVAQSSCKNKNRKKKKSNNNKPLAGAPTAAIVAAATGGGRSPCGDKRPCQPFGSYQVRPQYPVHNSRRHSAEECREIKKLTEQFREQQKQQPHCDGTPPCQREGK
jgi:hypothetical protein